METRKARMEAELNALKQEGEAEAALAAARVLEAAALEQSDFVDTSEPPAAASVRTEEYVRSHFHNNTNIKTEEQHNKPDDSEEGHPSVSTCCYTSRRTPHSVTNLAAQGFIASPT